MYRVLQRLDDVANAVRKRLTHSYRLYTNEISWELIQPALAISLGECLLLCLYIFNQFQQSQPTDL